MWIPRLKNLPAVFARFDPCVGKTPWRREWQSVIRTEEPGGLPSVVSQRVGRDWAMNTFTWLPARGGQAGPRGGANGGGRVGPRTSARTRRDRNPSAEGAWLRRTVGLGGQSDPDVKVRRFRKPAFGVSFLLPGLCGVGYLRGWGRSTTLRPRHGNYKIAARARPATSCKREGKGRGRRAAGGCFPSLTSVCLFCSWAYSSSHGKEDARWCGSGSGGPAPSLPHKEPDDLKKSDRPTAIINPLQRLLSSF